MMPSKRFVVKYISSNNCFAYLPDTWLRKLEAKENVVKIEHNDKRYFLSFIIRSNRSNILCLGTTFARSLNIEDGDEVIVTSIRDVPHLTKITVIPWSRNDKEILELQMEKVQSTLLNQIQIVAKDQPIIAWVSKFSSVTLITDALEPNFTYGRLEAFTEVHVTDEDRNTNTKNVHDSPNTSVFNNLCGTLKKIVQVSTMNSDRKNDAYKKEKNYELLRRFRRKCKCGVYRVHCLPKMKKNSILKSHAFNEIIGSPYHVFVSKKDVPPCAKFSYGFAMYKMKKISEDRQQASMSNTNFLKKDESSFPKFIDELTVKLFIIEELFQQFPDFLDEDYFNLDSVHNNVYVSESLRISLRIKTGSKVTLREIESGQKSVPLSIDVFSLKDATSVYKFENYVRYYSTYDQLLINSYAVIVLDDGNRCILRISPKKCTFAFIDPAILNRTPIHCRSVSPKADLLIQENLIRKERFRLEKVSMRHLTNILTECQITLSLSLGLRDLNFDHGRENILISGDVGSGKTTVCKILVEKFQSVPYFVYCHVIDCRSLKGKKVETLQKIVIASLSECVYYQPSILFLDDLESITNASTNDEENTLDAINAARIADMLVNMGTQYQESHYISIIATCASVNRIGQKLRPARGSHFFRTVLSIANLEKVDRIDILQLMLGDKLYMPGDVNWDYYGNKTEGWMVQDLVDMAEKATFAAWKRHEGRQPPIVITEEDMSVALNNFTPISLQGIQLYKGLGLFWSDIGGLMNVKRSLIETLQWPLIYPEVFKNAPIKLQNGVLLYGMPGTGKTMLAKAIANECGVNLISVKGPELLSKYIGVSEESVRNVFERAHRAKPCVLFFDEFDSLAPRRGHDSTGVTDRVVNQLLTQLDGVEDREGVAVVAASSRPDLIDPALLRPGRLDKSLYCPLPNEHDREDILIALCKMQNINTEELNLKELAECSLGFTGADLNAVVTQARLSALEDALADGEVGRAAIDITQCHLLKSVKSTHPSLSVAEKAKYNIIYGGFSNGGNFTEKMMEHQKATLA